MISYLKFIAACDVDNVIIASDAEGTGIFSINKMNWSSHLLKNINISGEKRLVFEYAFEYNNDIFFIPKSFDRFSRILIYHMQTDEIEYLDIKFRTEGFRPCCKVGKEIWMFPRKENEDAIIFSMEDNSVKVLETWKDSVVMYAIGKQNCVIGDVIQVDEYIYHTVSWTNIMVRINVKNHEVKTYKLPEDIRLSNAIDYDGNCFWMTLKDNEGIIAWNVEEGIVKWYNETLADYAVKHQWHNWFSFVICGKKYLWLVPTGEDQLLYMNYDTGRIEYIKINSTERGRKKWNYCGAGFTYISKCGNEVRLFPFAAESILCIDIAKDCLTEQITRIRLPDEWLEEDIIRYEYGLEKTAVEGRISLKDVIDIYNNDVDIDEKVSGNKCIGTNIWKNIAGGC